MSMSKQLKHECEQIAQHTHTHIHRASAITSINKTRLSKRVFEFEFVFKQHATKTIKTHYEHVHVYACTKTQYEQCMSMLHNAIANS